MVDWQALVEPLPSRFFVSYRSIEGPLAEAVEDALVETGQYVWRDRRSIYTSDDWKDEIDRALSDSDDVVIILTPAAAASQQVQYELNTAVRLGKRVHCYSTFNLERQPTIYAIIRHINYENLPDGLCGAAADPGILAKYVVERLLAPGAKPHPLDLRDFERLACRTVFPRFHTIWCQGCFNRDLLGRYGSYSSRLFGNPQRRNAAIALNAALLATHSARWENATTYFETSVLLEDRAMTKYYFALALMRQMRPRHMSAAVLDQSIQLITAAWQTRQSALIALTLVLLLWDGGRARGPKLATLFAEACNALAQTEPWRDEINRFRVLLPVNDEFALPVATNQFRRYLSQLGEYDEQSTRIG